MDTNTNKSPTPSLEALINAIDRRVDQLPSPYAAEGFAGFFGSRAEEYKKQGQHYIRFLLNSTAFALPLQNALEIDYVPEVTPLPNLPQWVLGICNLRGDIVSVVDLKQILHLKSRGADATSKLILIRNKDISTAITVDKVAGMRHADDKNNRVEKQAMQETAFSQYVQSVIDLDGQSVHLLDVDALMTAIAL